jgi:DNA-binding NarL/FixJ family response regulator
MATRFGRAAGTPRLEMAVTVVDHHPLVAHSVARSLRREGYRVTAANLEHPGTSLASVLDVALEARPHLVFLEPDLGLIGDGMALVAPLTRAGATVVLLTESVDRLRWGEAIRHGASRVLHKSCSLRDVVTTAHRVRDGLPLMSGEERRALVVSSFNDREEERTIRLRLNRLTAPEKEVLGALMTGIRVQQIAQARRTTETAVRSQIRSILSKLEITSQLAAVGTAHRVAWRPPAA